ncbi:MAG: hypothetical protein R3362_09210 [Rhodothermales bacterium]|nr:hypothetical protein [Rhodothermales bacterium]
MPAADPPPPTSPALPERVREVLPTVPALVRRVRAVAFVSAGAAVVLWGLVLGPSAWPLSGWTVVALLGLGVLLVPAGGTLVAVWTLEEVAALPARVRALTGEAAAASRQARERTAALRRERGGRRLWGLFGVLWRLRGFVEESRGTLLRTAALARLARLASLPFVLLLLGCFALNFVVIVAAAVALLAAAL